MEDVVAPAGGCCLALRAAARSSRFLISNCFASSGVGSLGVPPLDPVEELEPVPAPVIPQGPGHPAPPPPPMARTGSSSSTGSRGGTPREPTPEEAKQLEIRKREERAAARSARQQPPAGATTSSKMSASQKSMLDQFMRTPEYKALAPSVEEVNLASDEESGEHDEDYVPDSGKKKRR